MGAVLLEILPKNGKYLKSQHSRSKSDFMAQKNKFASVTPHHTEFSLQPTYISKKIGNFNKIVYEVADETDNPLILYCQNLPTDYFVLNFSSNLNI